VQLTGRIAISGRTGLRSTPHLVDRSSRRWRALRRIFAPFVLRSSAAPV